MFTVAQLAEELQVCRQTIYNKIDAGLIRHVHVGKSVRIPDDEVEYILKNGIRKVAIEDESE
jgi:excisionase family DNA binding protein